MDDFLKKHFDLREQLIGNKLTVSQTFDQLKQFPKPWETSAWKRESLKNRKQHCEQCGSKEGIMNLIHLRQPLPFYELKNWISSRFFHDFCEQNMIKEQIAEIQVTEAEIQDFKEKNTETRNACPKCKRVSIQKRKTIKPLFRCINCGFEFDEPLKANFIKIFNKTSDNLDLKKLLTFYKQESYFKQIKKVFSDNNDEYFGKLALIIGFNETEKYVAFTNTVTFCKRCAYLKNMQGQLLCLECNKAYFNFSSYENCYECSSKKDAKANPFKKIIDELEMEKLDLLQSLANNFEPKTFVFKNKSYVPTLTYYDLLQKDNSSNGKV